MPALRYDNPNPKGNKFVKFDGYEIRDGEVLLIDAKSGPNGIAPVHVPPAAKKQAEAFNRVAKALRQNPGVKVIYEFENESAMNRAKLWVRKERNFVNRTFREMMSKSRISFRVRKK